MRQANRVADVFTIALVKGDERYVILFSELTRLEALRQLGRWASDPELSFTWHDAAHLSRKIRNNFEHGASQCE